MSGTEGFEPIRKRLDSYLGKGREEFRDNFELLASITLVSFFESSCLSFFF